MAASDHPASDLIALDVGGANLKAADGLGWATSVPFAMWREWRRLPDALASLLSSHPRRIVATMTGEIADCFPRRAAGVRHIVSSLEAAAQRVGCDDIGIYRVDGRFESPRAACEDPLAVAASNWHAVARLAASLAPTDRSFLIDIGSTTVDVIPLRDGRPAPVAYDDAGRMASGELVYTGMERSPVAAVVRALPYRGEIRPVASERFAESRDAWLILGGLPEDPASTDTADGQPATRGAARVRLARSLLLEPDDFCEADALAAAERIAKAQARAVARAIDRVADRAGWQPTGFVISGHGDALADRVIALGAMSVDNAWIRDRAGGGPARSAPAHALALIARGTLP
ncbi:MAG: hydantoinase/oxoprolinase family protein [Planctomycetia bacterium]